MPRSTWYGLIVTPVTRPEERVNMDDASGVRDEGRTAHVTFRITRNIAHRTTDAAADVEAVLGGWQQA